MGTLSGKEQLMTTTDKTSISNKLLSIAVTHLRLFDVM